MFLSINKKMLQIKNKNNKKIFCLIEIFSIFYYFWLRNSTSLFDIAYHSGMHVKIFNHVQQENLEIYKLLRSKSKVNQWLYVK